MGFTKHLYCFRLSEILSLLVGIGLLAHVHRVTRAFSNHNRMNLD
jgi:hypothetical protein